MTKTLKYLLFLGFLVLGLGGAFWAYNSLFSSRANVILIVLDTLRADHLGVYGYERDTSRNLDNFAKNSIWFSRAMTSAPWTPPALGSFFTGLYASAHGMMPPNGRELARKASSMLDQKNETIAEILKRNGYQTAGITPNPWIKAEFGYDQGFDNYYYRDRARAEEITRAGEKVIKGFDKNKPFFLFIHYLDPHDPYNPPGEYAKKYQGALKAAEYDEKTLEDMNLYDGEVRYMDDMLGKFFESLKQAGVWDNSLIIVVADHGEQFKEHGNQGHGFQLYNEEVHVPLFVKAGSQARKEESLASSVDIFPTILDWAGVAKPPQAQGVSLLNAEALKARRGVLSEIDRKYNWKSFTSSDGYRLIFDYGQGEQAAAPSEFSLFNWITDGYGRAPMQDAQLSRELKTDFDSLYQSVLMEKIEAESKNISEGTLEQLKSLGYMK